MSRYRPVSERLTDFKPVELRLPPDVLEKELKCCQDCGIPFCHAVGCTLANVIPEINAAALAGRWESALANLQSTSPFPEITGRICPALCEGSCVQGLNGLPVPCRLVEYEVIERGFDAGWIRPRPPLSCLPYSAAVIGSGPAGLAVAWRLNQAGLAVTVYERDLRPGGFLRYGIPDFKLAKDILDRRITLLEQEGIKFECGVEAGVDISERLLQRRYDLVVLAVGARRQRDLDLPGRELAGIHQATDYLSAQNRVLARELAELPPAYNAKGARVVVIGGGDTGSDCVGTARRQGAREVTQLEIMPRPPETRAAANPWPEWPRVLKTTSSHEEGVDRLWSVSTLGFLPATGDLTRAGQIHCQKVKWLEENGRLIRSEPIAGSDFNQPADLVLLALGFTGVEKGSLISDLGLNPDQRGCLPRDTAGRLASRVYSCGDAALGPSLVVRAIADGLNVAETILSDLTDQT